MNPYKTPSSEQRRVFKTPIIVPLSVIMVIAIYVGYALFFMSGNDVRLFSYLGGISFQVYLLCDIGMVSLVFYNKRQLSNFLRDYPVISDRKTLELLKPIVRTNMYSALFFLVFLGLGSFTAIMSILNNGLIKGIVVAVLSVAVAKLVGWYSPTEESVKQIECTDDSLEPELNDVLQCWMHKPLPRF